VLAAAPWSACVGGEEGCEQIAPVSVGPGVSHSYFFAYPQGVHADKDGVHLAYEVPVEGGSLSVVQTLGRASAFALYAAEEANCDAQATISETGVGLYLGAEGPPKGSAWSAYVARAPLEAPNELAVTDLSSRVTSRNVGALVFGAGFVAVEAEGLTLFATGGSATAAFATAPVPARVATAVPGGVLAVNEARSAIDHYPADGGAPTRVVTLTPGTTLVAYSVDRSAGRVVFLESGSTPKEARLLTAPLLPDGGAPTFVTQLADIASSRHQGVANAGHYAYLDSTGAYRVVRLSDGRSWQSPPLRGQTFLLHVDQTSLLLTRDITSAASPARVVQRYSLQGEPPNPPRP